MGGAEHRREVAAEVARVADVQRDHVEHVVAQPSGLVELHRRDAQALLVDFRRHRIVGAVRRAADVALVRAHDGPEQPLAAIEHRHERRHVRQMAAAVIGIVHQDHVARLHVADAFLDRARRPGQRADMHGDVVGLRDQPRLRVADRQREIAAGVQDLRVGRAQHRFAHLGDDGAEAMLDDGAGDGIDWLALMCAVVRTGISVPKMTAIVTNANSLEPVDDDVRARLASGCSVDAMLSHRVRIPEHRRLVGRSTRSNISVEVNMFAKQFAAGLVATALLSTTALAQAPAPKDPPDGTVVNDAEDREPRLSRRRPRARVSGVRQGGRPLCVQ